MNNIIYEILDATDNVSFYNRRLYLLNKDTVKYANRRKIAGKALITNLSDAIWMAIGSDDCKLELNWLYFLFGDSMCNYLFARGGVSGRGYLLMEKFNESECYKYELMQDRIRYTRFRILMDSKVKGLEACIARNNFFYLELV